MKFLLFDWTIEGHHGRYLRCFAEALRGMGEVVVAAPAEIAREVSDLGARILVLPDQRTPVDPARPIAPQNRQQALRELDLVEAKIREVQPDHLIHLSADPIIRRLVERPSLGVPTTLLIFAPRAHYPSVYNTPLSTKELMRAWFLEYLVARWRRRPDAHTILTLDAEAAHRWSRGPGGAHWLPEPPLGPIPPLPSTQRTGCVLYGSLARRKGIHLLARAITLAPIDIRIVLAGAVEKGFESELQRLVQEMRSAGATVDVHSAQMSEAQGLETLANARCAVLPYPRHYGMSRVLLEASAVHTPVVTTDRGMLGHLVRKHRLGISVDCENPHALRQSLLELCTEDLSFKYATAQGIFVDNFSQARFAATLAAAFGRTPSTSASRETYFEREIA